VAFEGRQPHAVAADEDRDDERREYAGDRESDRMSTPLRRTFEASRQERRTGQGEAEEVRGLGGRVVGYGQVECHEGGDGCRRQNEKRRVHGGAAPA
jgi:hypothetical protein